MDTNADSVRLKLHLVIQSGDGKRIAEFEEESVFHDVLTLGDWRRNDRPFREMLAMKVVDPARCLVAAHVHTRGDYATE
jgi:hypothetical protein